MGAAVQVRLVARPIWAIMLLRASRWTALGLSLALKPLLSSTECPIPQMLVSIGALAVLAATAATSDATAATWDPTCPAQRDLVLPYWTAFSLNATMPSGAPLDLQPCSPEASLSRFWPMRVLH